MGKSSGFSVKSGNHAVREHVTIKTRGWALGLFDEMKAHRRRAETNPWLKFKIRVPIYKMRVWPSFGWRS